MTRSTVPPVRLVGIPTLIFIMLAGCQSPPSPPPASTPSSQTSDTPSSTSPAPQTTTSIPIENPDTGSERQALAAIYQATGGKRWSRVMVG